MRYVNTPTCLVVTGLVLLAGCERRPPGPVRVKQSREVMGTFAELTAYAPDRATAQQAVAAGYAALDRVNALMSDYVDDSEIGRLNALAAGENLVVSAETFACLSAAAEVAERSGGAFDVTCRPLVKLWQQAGQANKLPEETAIEAALSRVGWDKLRLEPDTRRVTPLVEGLHVDLGGIAKGYALDLAAAAMEGAGATHALVNIGGDVRAAGSRPGGEPWRVWVQHPVHAQRLYCALGLKDGAVATSGVQQRFAEIDGRRYSHIIDPRSGRPAAQAPSVTVIAPDGATADAWATAFSVLTVEEGQALAATAALDGVEVLWLVQAGDEVTAHQTAGFGEYVID